MHVIVNTNTKNFFAGGEGLKWIWTGDLSLAQKWDKSTAKALASRIAGSEVVRYVEDLSDWAKEKGFVKNVGTSATITNSISKEKWPFANMGMLNTYNSFISNNNDTMETSKITEAITNGFNAMIEKLGLTNKKDDQVVVDAFKGFSESITNTIKDIAVPNDSAIGVMVNAAIVEALKEVPESFKNAITKATENSITKDDLKNQMETLTNSLVEKLGNKAVPPANKKKPVGPANRFRGVNVWPEEGAE